jgi:hypothetical protein
MKKAVLSLYNREFATQAIRVEREKFIHSILRYFEDSSEGTLYSDLISMFRGLNAHDKCRFRLRKSVYILFLHILALEQNQYHSVIMTSLKVIFNRSYQRVISIRSQKLNKSEALERGQSEFDSLFNQHSGKLTPVIATTIDNISSNTLRNAAIAAGVCSAAIIGAVTHLPFAVGIGAVCAAGFIALASWSRESVWRFMAQKSRKSVQDDNLSKDLRKILEEAVKNSEIFKV